MDAVNIQIESTENYMGTAAIFLRCDVTTDRGYVDGYAYRGVLSGDHVYVTAWGGGAEDGRHVGYVRAESHAGRFPKEVAATLRGLLQ